jgi:DNA (cytosine-5)-methyltransferase 1
MMENVPGMLSTNKGAFVKKLLEEFDKVGYNIQLPVKVLNADDFGVPQRRSRVIIIGVRKDLNITINYPTPTHISPRAKVAKEPDLFTLDLPKTPTIRDAIEDLPQIDRYKSLIEYDFLEYDKAPKSIYAKIMRGELHDPDDLSTKVDWDKNIATGLKRTIHGPVLTKRCRETPPGENLPVSRLFKLDWNGIANTLRAGTPRERGAYSSPRPIHPSQPRVICVREGARIQSFPDWIRFHPTKWNGFRQIGNSVSPLVGRVIARSILNAIKIHL